jgi:DNA-binding SARP family transcriptional activator/tetratricopeptide (TPR) repeat protein
VVKAGTAEFCLLGPLVVRCGGVEIPVRRGKQRALLATLLLNSGRVVPVDELAEALWGAAPPPSARVTVQNYVTRLRKALGDADRDRISTLPGGYLIRVDAGELDVSRFEALLRSARAAARDGAWHQAADRARAALALWRDEPLADVGSELLVLRAAPPLMEMRLQALETRIEADIRLGSHADVLPELRRLTADHPLREHPHALLMLALYRCGRQAEALAAYQDARHVLVGELGAEPGTELRELHQKILAGDPLPAPGKPTLPESASPGTVPGDGSPAAIVPRQLPGVAAHFTGRTAELTVLDAMLEEAVGHRPGTVVISAIGGTAGVGKTTLAVHWAHNVADRFPDGQLYVNLRGYDPGQPVPAGDALAGFLRALGVPGQDIPPEAEERAARYRSLLADRQMLVILDNAGSAEQVRPLLPGTPACTVLVTSRDALAGLVARDGATRLDLDVLPLAEAVALLRALIGPRVDAEPTAAAELAGQCCRLPLALRVAAELTVSRPDVPLAGLTGELADLRTRLDLLDAGGDPRTQVRGVFSWSYRHLHATDAQAFRLLGLHPGPDFEPYAAAALAGTTVPRARRTLDALACAHLIQAAAPGRYGMHDLLRGYARELSATVDGDREQRAALTRLFDHYLHAAAAAMDALFPAERHHRPRVPRPDTPVPSLLGPAAARDWLDAERAALVAAAGHAAADGWPGHATRLSATLSRYLRICGHFPEARTVFSHALGAARRTGDRAAEATALTDIGLIDGQLCHFQQAGDHFRQALALFRAAGDRAGQARALANMGLAETELGRYEHAARHLQEALAIYRDTGDRFGEARALGYLGLARQRQGRYQEAISHHQQTLDLSRDIGDRESEAGALCNLGTVDLRLGRYQPAAGYFRQALTLVQEVGSTVDEPGVRIKLGEVYLELGRYGQAASNFEQALAMSRKIGYRAVEAVAQNGLGDVLFRTGDAGKARAHHAAALRLASEAGSPRDQAHAHHGLARACQAGGDQVQARYHWQQAFTRYAAIGAPEAREIRARLAAIGDGGDDSDKPTAEDRATTASFPG